MFTVTLIQLQCISLSVLHFHIFTIIYDLLSYFAAAIGAGGGFLSEQTAGVSFSFKKEDNINKDAFLSFL